MDILYSILSFIQIHYVKIILITAIIISVYILVFLFYKIRKAQVNSLRYDRSFSQEGAFEGECIYFTEEITNTSALPLFFCDVEMYIYGQLRLDGYEGLHVDDMQYFVSRFHLPPRATVRRTRKITLLKRGVYDLTTATVYVRNTPHYLESTASLYVYPKYKNISDFSDPMNSIQGDAKTKRRLLTDPFSLNGIRNIAPGDPFSLINFKATAKTGGRIIKVNERDFCSGRVFMLYINFAQPPDDPIPADRYEPLMEDALSFACSLIRKSISDGYRVGFGANCKTDKGYDLKHFLPSSSVMTAEEIYKEMAKIRLSEGISFNSMLEKNLPFIKDCEICILSTHISPETDAIIKAYKRRNNNVTLIKLQ